MRANGEHLRQIAEWVDAGKITPLLDEEHQFPFSETASAFEYLQQGHATGKVVRQTVCEAPHTQNTNEWQTIVMVPDEQ